MKLRFGVPSERHNAFVIILVIAVVAGSLSFASYQYANSVSNGIENSSIASANTSIQIEVSEINHILVNQLVVVGRNLQSLSVSESVETQNTTAASPLFIAAENSTSELTSTYFWISSNGSLLVAKNSTGDVAAVAGVNLTQRPYFVAVRQSGIAYYGDVFYSLKLVPEVVIAQPIFVPTVVDGQANRTFAGIIAASIELPTLGKFLESQLSGNLNAALGAIDPSGLILYSGNQTLLGQSIFGTQFQSLLPGGIRPSFNSFLTLSLMGGSGIYDLSYNGTHASIAYQPVLINGTNSQTKPKLFAVIYILTSHVLAADQAAQINLLRLFFTASVFIIGISGVVAAAFVLSWNSTLDGIIKRKTADLVAANAELATQSQAQKDLINIAAHELRTPAQSILASSELLKEALNPALISTQQYVPSGDSLSSQTTVPSPSSKMSDDDKRDLVDSTFRNAQRLQKLTQNLLEVARIDTNSVNLEKETFDLNEKIRSVVEDFNNVLDVQRRHGNNIRLDVETSDGTLIVRADKIKTYEVISNLFLNAIRHSKSVGLVTVTTEKSGGYALVSVRDGGTGIDLELLPRLFEKFATNSGTGLGLYISKSYVEAQGGKIWAENNIAAGATFSFTIPLAL